MEEKYIFIDCDGVILDSEQRMNKKKEERGYLNHNDGKEFDDYFKLADSIEGEWEYILKVLVHLIVLLKLLGNWKNEKKIGNTYKST